MTYRKTTSWAALFFFGWSLCLSPATYADQAISLDPQSGQQVLVQSLDEANQAVNSAAQDSLIVQAVDAHGGHSDSPLSPAGENHVVINASFQASHQPPEASFLTQVSEGVYVMEFDDYFKSILSDLLDPTIAAGFTPDELVNVELAAVNQRLQENFGDLFDFITLFPTAEARDSLANFHFLTSQTGGGVPMGFGAAQKDDIEGIGFIQDDPVVSELNERFGPRFAELFSTFMQFTSSRGALQGLSWLDLVSIEKNGSGVPGFTDFVLLQEMAHRWGVFLGSGGHKGGNQLGILGRDQSHWSSFFNAGNSPMDGIEWHDNGDGTFTLQRLFGVSWTSFAFDLSPVHINLFNDFDLYAMGLMAPSSVSPSFVIDNPRHPDGTTLTDENFLQFLFSSSDSFFFNPTIQGTRRNVTINEVIQIEGPRNPPAGALQTQKNFSNAMVILKDKNENSSIFQSILSQVTALGNRIAGIWKQATRSLSTMTLGIVPGAFNTFRNHILSSYDAVITAIQNGTDFDGKSVGPALKNDLNVERQRAQNNQINATELENLMTSIEALLNPMVTTGVFRSDLKSSLGNLPAEMAQIKQTFSPLNSSLKSNLFRAGNIDTQIASGKNQIQSKADQSQSSGILPLGFGRQADEILEDIEDEYIGTINSLKAASQAFESQHASLRTTVTNTLNNVQSIFNAFIQTLQTERAALQTEVSSRQTQFANLKTELHQMAADLNASRAGLKDRVEHARNFAVQESIGPQSGFQTLLTDVNQWDVPTSNEIDASFQNAEDDLQTIILMLGFLLTDLQDLRDGKRAPLLLTNSATLLRGEKSDFKETDIANTVRQPVDQSSSELAGLRNRFRPLFLELVNAVDLLFVNFLGSRQVSIDALIVQRDSATALNSTLAPKINSLKTKILTLITPEISGSFNARLLAHEGRFNILTDNLNAEKNASANTFAAIDQIRVRQNQVTEVKNWGESNNFPADSLAFLDTQLSALGQAKDFLEAVNGQALNQEIASRNSNFSGISNQLNQLKTDMDQLEADINAALDNQSSQLAQEAALDRDVTALITETDTVQTSFNNFKTALPERQGNIQAKAQALDQKVSLAVSMAAVLSQITSQINPLLDFGPVTSLVSEIEADMASLIQNRNLLADLRAEVLSTHSLLKLQDAQTRLGNLRNQADSIHQKLGNLETLLQTKETKAGSLENQLIQDLAEAVKNLESLVTAFRQTESQNETALRSALTGHEQTFSTLQAGLQNENARIGTLLDPEVKTSFQNQAQALQSEFNGLGQSLGLFNSELGGFAATLGGFSNFQTRLEAFESWVKDRKILTEASSELSSRVQDFQLIQQNYDNRSAVITQREKLSADQSSLAARLTNAANALNSLKSSLNQALQEQADQVAEEAALNQSAIDFDIQVKALRTALNALAGFFDSEQAGLIQRGLSLEQRIQILLPVTGNLQTLSDSLQTFLDFNSLNAFYAAIQNDLSVLESNRDDLLELRNEVLTNHSLAKLRQAKEFLNQQRAQEAESRGKIADLQNSVQSRAPFLKSLEDTWAGEVLESLADFGAEIKRFTDEENAKQTQLDSALKNLKGAAGERKNDLLIQEGRIQPLFDPDLKALFQTQITNLRETALTPLENEIGQALSKVNELFGSLAGLNGFGAGIKDFESWAGEGKLLTASLAELGERADDFKAAVQAFDLRGDLITQREALEIKKNDFNQRHASLQNAVTSLKNSIDEAFREQANQLAEELTFNQSLDQLKTAIGQRREVLNQLSPRLSPKEISLRDGLSDFKARLDAAAEFIQKILVHVNDHGSLNQNLAVFSADFSGLTSGFGQTENLLTQLEADRQELNQAHSLLKLRQVKEKLLNLQNSFNQSAAILNLEGRMTALEAGFVKARDSFHGSLLDFALGRKNEAQNFLNQKQEEIGDFQSQIEQVQVFLAGLRLRSASLRLEVEALGDLVLQERLIEMLDASRIFSENAEGLLVEAQILAVELPPSLNPLSEELNDAVQTVAWLGERKDLSEEVSILHSRLQNLNQIPFAIAGFEASASPFQRLGDFPGPSWAGMLFQSAALLGQIQFILHPPVILQEALSTHFEILVLRKTEKQVRRLFAGTRAGRLPENRRQNYRIRNRQGESEAKTEEAKRRRRLFEELARLRKLLLEKSVLEKPVPQTPWPPVPPVIPIPEDAKPSSQEQPPIEPVA